MRRIARDRAKSDVLLSVILTSLSRRFAALLVIEGLRPTGMSLRENLDQLNTILLELRNIDVRHVGIGLQPDVWVSDSGAS